MNKYIKEVLKYILLFSFSFTLYENIEMLYRSQTFWWSGIMGGISFIIIGAMNNLFPWDMSIGLQGLFGMFVILIVEYIVGINFNQDYSMWDYRGLHSINGQISLEFAIIWFFMAILCIVLDDWLRYYIFNEEKPHYKLF